MNFIWKYKWTKRKEVSGFKHFLSKVRKIGKDKILERLNDLKNKDHVPNDILSSILNNWSKFFIKSKKQIWNLWILKSINKIKRI